jgi:hypothetical protein
LSDKYILVDGLPTQEPDLLKWGRWFETADNERIVMKTELEEEQVSTVFLGVDHSFGRKLLPILWETMIFGGPHDQWQERYTSRDEAVRRHHEIVGKIKSGTL